MRRLKEQIINKVPTDLAAGWYVGCPSGQIKQKPVALQLFGQDLVGWRDNKGNPVIMERYCSHMGASLAQGKVINGCLQCPFHEWKYDKTGRCVDAPEVESIPKTAWQHTYPTQERYGYIWVWYGSPEPLYSIPEFTPAESERKEYMPLRFAFDIRTKPRRILENFYDQRHLMTVHKVQASKVWLDLLDKETNTSNLSEHLLADTRFKAKMNVQLERYIGIMGLLTGLVGLNVESAGYQIESWSGGHAMYFNINGQLSSTLLLTLTPITANETRQNFLFLVKKTGSLPRNLFNYLAFGLQHMWSAAKDIPIWNEMQADGGKAPVKSDLGVITFRKFYEKWVSEGLLQTEGKFS